MIILKETTDAQEIYFIPRSFIFNRIVFTNEETGAEQEFSVVAEISGQYGYAELVLDLVQLDWYTMKVYNDTDLLYYDKVFCTNQDIENFTINENVYVSPTPTDNDFIKL